MRLAPVAMVLVMVVTLARCVQVARCEGNPGDCPDGYSCQSGSRGFQWRVRGVFGQRVWVRRFPGQQRRQQQQQCDGLFFIGERLPARQRVYAGRWRGPV
jgi:hypothetical protein